MLTPEQRKFGMQFLKRLDNKRVERGAIIAALEGAARSALREGGIT